MKCRVAVFLTGRIICGAYRDAVLESLVGICNVRPPGIGATWVVHLASATGCDARVEGMAQIASQTGLSREQLYRSFSASGNPTLKTVLAVMKALGVELTARGVGGVGF